MWSQKPRSRKSHCMACQNFSALPMMRTSAIQRRVPQFPRLLRPRTKGTRARFRDSAISAVRCEARSVRWRREVGLRRWLGRLLGRDAGRRRAAELLDCDFASAAGISLRASRTAATSVPARSATSSSLGDKVAKAASATRVSRSASATFASSSTSLRARSALRRSTALARRCTESAILS